MVACRYGISLLVFNLTSHSSMIIPTRAHDYSLFIWEFGGFWGTAPLRQIFRVSHDFGNWRSSCDFRWVYHIHRKDELIKHSAKFLLQREFIGVCFWTQFKCYHREPLIPQKLWSGMVLKGFFLIFFIIWFCILYKQLDYWVFIKKNLKLKSSPAALFF